MRDVEGAEKRWIRLSVIRISRCHNARARAPRENKNKRSPEAVVFFSSFTTLSFTRANYGNNSGSTQEGHSEATRSSLVTWNTAHLRATGDDVPDLA